MPDMESVITHLQIIHTWAEFARERDLQFFTAKHLEDIAKWSDDAIALLKEQEPSGWISVKDRLPEDEDDVLIYGVSPRGRKKTAIMNYLAFDADRPRWAFDGIWTVIYWMPLPEPPKEEKQ